MSKNLIPEIVKLLGVVIGEEFKIDTNRTSYRFTNTGLEYYDPSQDAWKETEGLVLYRLLQGKRDIIRLPWKPKYDEKYWTFIGIDFCIWEDTWQGSAMDYAILNSNIIFRTEAEAIEKRPEVYKKLTGKDWEENEES